MFRQDAPENFCMLFRFSDDGVRWFWMKNCEFPIVVVFCSSDWRVTAAHRMKVEHTADDCSLKRYSSVTPVRYAIEFRDFIPPGEPLRH